MIISINGLSKLARYASIRLEAACVPCDAVSLKCHNIVTGHVVDLHVLLRTDTVSAFLYKIGL